MHIVNFLFDDRVWLVLDSPLLRLIMLADHLELLMLFDALLLRLNHLVLVNFTRRWLLCQVILLRSGL